MPYSFSKTSFTFLLLFPIPFQLALAQTSPSLIPKDELLFQKGVLLQQLATEGLGLNETIRDKQVDESKSVYATEIKENILDDAFKYYQELTDSFPKSACFYKALINQGLIKLELQDTVVAEKLFQLVLGKTNEKDKKKGEQEVIRSPNADPYSDSKNDAAKMLAEISLENREYQRALSFLDERKKYPRNAMWGQDSDAVYTTTMYGKCYMGLKKYQKACDVLLPDLFSDELDAESCDLVYEALLKISKKEELLKKYELAFKNFTNDKSKSSYFILFLNRRIDIEPLLKQALLIQDAAYPGNEIDKICKNTWLYERLQPAGENKKP
jgi:tetratricopeptide (TPR) repeat protein